MSKIETNDVMVGPVVSEGGRSPSTLSSGHGGVGQRGLAPGQRWSVGRKREVVLRLLRGDSVELLSRELGVPLYRLEQWRQKADAALDGALKEREVDPAQEVAVMATAISPTAGRRYGVARVCEVWDLPRSSFYAARQQQVDAAAAPPPAQRRGPKPVVSDEALLAAIRADLARSPWTGEGHRKVWARLRVIDVIRVARKRVLRVMREHSLLSPHRARTRSEEPHDRHIITQAPNVMWATDATQIATVQDGKVWLFGVIEHWNAVRQQFGHISPGVARGLALRHDHGSNFMADHFQKQIRSWGIAPSFAFVAEPQTNGVIERFFRTFKEQVVHGRIYQTIDDVRDAVRSFVARYNAEWLIEKNAYTSPTQARAAWREAAFRHAA